MGCNHQSCEIHPPTQRSQSILAMFFIVRSLVHWLFLFVCLFVCLLVCLFVGWLVGSFVCFFCWFVCSLACSRNEIYHQRGSCICPYLSNVFFISYLKPARRKNGRSIFSQLEHTRKITVFNLADKSILKLSPCFFD